jgi:hypothetical protein
VIAEWKRLLVGSGIVAKWNSWPMLPEDITSRLLANRAGFDTNGEDETDRVRAGEET